jgi:predicted SAM-dependent methyltransferase
MRYVNLGCGSRLHPAWINIDIEPTAPGVIAHDLSKGIPLDDGSCDVVYHSHVLEHIRRQGAAAFLRECLRVLKPGGIIRVVVPDLERICRAYLEKMELALSGDPAAAADYDWIMLELFDQTTRERSGGEMGAWLRRSTLANEKFIYERIGEEGRRMIESVRGQRKAAPADGGRADGGPSIANRAGDMIRRIRHGLGVIVLGGGAREALAVGRFRMGGEVHQWMYDRFSLARMLVEAGFRDPIQQSATGSLIPDWSAFDLDTLADGTVVKPDSLFMEAVNPG